MKKEECGVSLEFNMDDRGCDMIFGPMDENEMNQYLHEMNLLAKKIEKRKKEAYRAVETLEESIERNSLPASVREFHAAGVGTKDKVFDILQRSYRDIERQLEDISQELLQITEEEEKLYFVKKCIRELPIVQADLIKELVIEGCNWEAFGRRNYISRATISRRRKAAMRNLLCMYNVRFSKDDGGVK